MTMQRIIACAALGLSALIGATGAMAQSSTLRIGLAEDPDILDPTLARTYVGRIVFASLCDKLFDIDEKLAIVPQLALGHETSADGKTVTVKLRSGVKFHDGEPFDAEAAKFSLERHLGMQGSFRRVEIAQIDKVDAVDRLTIRLHLKAPFAPLIAQLTDRAGMMVSPKAAKAAGDKFGTRPVCAGPYKFVERVAQDRIVVERFADYWDKGRVHIDRIVYQPIQDSTVRLANLKAGGLDLIERMLATDIGEVKKDAKLKLATGTELGYQGITINVNNGEKSNNPLAKNAKVRQAFELALDRDAINQVVFNGVNLTNNQWVSPSNPYYLAKFPTPKRDVARARALIKEAGVATPIALDFMVPNNPESRAVAEVMQSMGAEAGFDLKIRVTEFATSLNEGEKGNYHIYFLAWSGRTDPDGNIYSFASCGGPLNYGRFCDPKVDELLNRARTATTQAARKAAYEEAAAKILPEGGVLYLYHRTLLFAHSARLEGFRVMPDGLIRATNLRLK
ncbi:MAG: ABC transporter substrate-binding protein [Betaproteobacteria bacterium]|nr:ABC transporter substrate-binding protein [Betaproteobacteria bacterium]